MTLAPIRLARLRRWRHHAPLLLMGAVLLAAVPLPVAAEMAQAPKAAPKGLSAGGESFAPSNPNQLGLAEHLRREGYMFYGAWWCPACTQQKALFGKQAAQRLPYQECEKDAAGQQRCTEAAIRVYPTWIKGGERRDGVLTLEELQRWSGYRPGGATPARTTPAVTTP
jgi:hypothetical protein